MDVNANSAACKTHGILAMFITGSFVLVVFPAAGCPPHLGRIIPTSRLFMEMI